MFRGPNPSRSVYLRRKRRCSGSSLEARVVKVMVITPVSKHDAQNTSHLAGHKPRKVRTNTRSFKLKASEQGSEAKNGAAVSSGGWRP